MRRPTRIRFGFWWRYGKVNEVANKIKIFVGVTENFVQFDLKSLCVGFFIRVVDPTVKPLA
ncbi:MAG: hypothetical protein H8E66_35140 [Planctomycetes bacterium]|nr:hypothetical protein [Planctomycetota bacterium]